MHGPQDALITVLLMSILHFHSRRKKESCQNLRKHSVQHVLLFSLHMQMWIGGNKNQTRMAEVYAERVKVSNECDAVAHVRVCLPVCV